MQQDNAFQQKHWQAIHPQLHKSADGKWQQDEAVDIAVMQLLRQRQNVVTTRTAGVMEDNMTSDRTAKRASCAETTLTRSRGATAVLAMALDPPRVPSCRENSLSVSQTVAAHGSGMLQAARGAAHLQAHFSRSA